MRKLSGLSAVVAAQIMVLAGCVPATLAPTVVVTPGPGKSPADFTADQTWCVAQANQQMAPAIQATNNQLVGGALLGVTPDQTVQSAQSAQVTLQQQYNISYSTCMYAKGDIVPGFAPPVVAEPESAPVTHRRVAKKPTQQPAGSASVAPAPAVSATQGGSGFVVPAPAAAATPASASGNFVVPAPASQ
jgi:hypothetical protein